MIQVKYLVYFLEHSKCSKKEKRKKEKCCYYYIAAVSEIFTLHDFRDTTPLFKASHLLIVVYDPFIRGSGISFYNYSSNSKQLLGGGNVFIQIHTKL